MSFSFGPWIIHFHAQTIEFRIRCLYLRPGKQRRKLRMEIDRRTIPPLDGLSWSWWFHRILFFFLSLIIARVDRWKINTQWTRNLLEKNKRQGFYLRETLDSSDFQLNERFHHFLCAPAPPSAFSVFLCRGHCWSKEKLRVDPVAVRRRPIFPFQWKKKTRCHFSPHRPFLATADDNQFIFFWTQEIEKNKRGEHIPVAATFVGKYKGCTGPRRTCNSCLNRKKRVNFDQVGTRQKNFINAAQAGSIFFFFGARAR